jgi:hypothetical protein
MPRHAIIVICSCINFAIQATAGLGDSRKAIEARYGKEISSSIMQSGLVVTYIHGEYYITVIYNKEGFCQSESILKKRVESLDGKYISQVFNEEEIQEFLQDNESFHGQLTEKFYGPTKDGLRTWETDDGKVIVSLALWDQKDGLGNPVKAFTLFAGMTDKKLMEGCKGK